MGVLDSIKNQFDDEPGGGFADGGLGTWQLEGGGEVDAFKPSRLTERFTNPEKFQEGTEAREEFVGNTHDLDPGRVYNRAVNEDGDPNRDNPDPTDPDNWPGGLQWLSENLDLAIYAVIGLYVLSVLGPVLEIGANLTE